MSQLEKGGSLLQGCAQGCSGTPSCNPFQSPQVRRKRIIPVALRAKDNDKESSKDRPGIYFLSYCSKFGVPYSNANIMDTHPNWVLKNLNRIVSGKSQNSLKSVTSRSISPIFQLLLSNLRKPHTFSEFSYFKCLVAITCEDYCEDTWEKCIK